MRLLTVVGCAIGLFAQGVSAQTTFAPDDVSILLAAPETSGSPVLPLPESSLSAATAKAAAGVIVAFGHVADDDAEVAIDPTVLGERRAQLHIAGIRLDPGAPGLTAPFGAFGPAPQLRLVAQPVMFQDGKAVVRDEAVHLVYNFGSRAPTQACPFRIEPDIPGFAAAVDDLLRIKIKLAEAGVSTDGAPLGVHPAFADPATAKQFVEELAAFIGTYATEDRLFALSVAGLPAEAPNPWMFLAFSRDQSGAVKPVPLPAVAQMPEATKFVQMIDFSDGSGKVVPPGRTRNLLPIDCLANFLPGVQPGPEDGRTTSELFAAGANTPEAAASVAAVVADTARAHFFNTDCVSCHTETRREIYAAADRDATSAAIASREGIDPEAMPRSPADSDRSLDNWNIRAFGWFPGVPAGARAHATVVRRTARETADVVACLNSGNWRDPSRPCLGDGAGAGLPASETVQGWSPLVRAEFYHSSQGSSLMPVAYFLALERSDGAGKFAAPEHLAGYGFLPSDNASGLNPLELPVGLALTGPDVGLNCAACHTADVIVNGKRQRIDGAPAALDFDRFLSDLAAALQDTVQLDREGKPTPGFAAFLAAAGETTPGKALAFAAEFAGRASLRRPAHPSGPGRVDALTQIVNALAVSDLRVPANLRTPAAPASYPALWLAPRLEFVQWNLSAADPLSRNVGQAQGVFGRTELTGEPRFATSANLATLSAYEEWLWLLEAPRWSEKEFGPIDAGLAMKGRALFAGKCEGCHNAPPFRMSGRADNLRNESFIKVGAIPVDVAGTDPLYTRALVTRWVETGAMAPVFGDKPLVPAALFFRTVVGATTDRLLREAGATPEEAAMAFRLRPADHKDCAGAGKPCPYAIPGGGMALKAGPLLGVWATGPYLHNGSVRTVYELLSPPEERAVQFRVGDRTIDLEKLGFADTDVEGAYVFDTRLPGNGAQGHDFDAVKLTHEERMAVIEYLKDPERFPIPR